eukprot:15048833-Alexandrium_andersonii.AAC.1
MSASLVGSEMCIRDSCKAVQPYLISRSLRATGSEQSSWSLERQVRPGTSSVSAAVRNPGLSPRWCPT